MAIGTAAAIGLGVAGVGSVLSSSSNRRAANRAADTSERNAQLNADLMRDIYNQNQQVLSPFVNRGNAAGDQINALLGLGGAANNNGGGYTGGGAGGAGGTMPAGYGYGLTDGTAGYNPALVRDANPLTSSSWGGGMAPNGFWQQRMANPASQNTPTGQPTMGGGGMSAQDAAENAFDIFRNSTGYQFRLGEGMDALNSGYAGAGTLQSGAAMKAALEYGQNFASNEFGNYMNALGNQQSVGAQSGGALAGVGMQHANSMTQNNNMNAANQANAQLMRGQNGIGGTLGLMGGVLAGL